MKHISVVIPCYNEVGNVEPMCKSILELFDDELKDYELELIFIDNDSNDGTQTKLMLLCEVDHRVKAIFNARNFGAYNSPTYGLLQASGDCSILLACDFQEPVELIPKFIEKWEKGAQVVAGVRTGHRQNPFKYTLRSLYYKLIRMGSDLDHIDHFTGFGLYDRSFLEILRGVDDPMPFIRGMVAEFAHNVETVEYKQPKRKHGKTHHSFSDLYDAAMLSFTSYTSMGLRSVVLLGFIIASVSFVVGIIYLIKKLLHWYTFDAGMAPLLIGVFFLGAVILIAVGLIGEYIMSINKRVMKRPLVVERGRIGFEQESKNKK